MRIEDEGEGDGDADDDVAVGMDPLILSPPSFEFSVELMNG